MNRHRTVVFISLCTKANQELHTLRWLNPEVFGPFDHKWNVRGDKDTDAKGADILCTDEDGDLVDDCYAGADDVKGITHYRVTVFDDTGDTEYKETIETHGRPVYTAQFTLNDDSYTFAVEAGYEDGGGKFYALSDRAQVEFDIPGDYRKYHQDTEIVNALLNDIFDSVYKEGDDFDAFYDSDWNFTPYSADGEDERLVPIVTVPPAEVLEDGVVPNQAAIDTANTANAKSRQHALTIYLNNLYN